MKKWRGSNPSERDPLLQQFAEWMQVEVVTLLGKKKIKGNLILDETQNVTGKKHNTLIPLRFQSFRHPLHHHAPFAQHGETEKAFRNRINVWRKKRSGWGGDTAVFQHVKAERGRWWANRGSCGRLLEAAKGLWVTHSATPEPWKARLPAAAAAKEKGWMGTAEAILGRKRRSQGQESLSSTGTGATRSVFYIFPLASAVWIQPFSLKVDRQLSVLSTPSRGFELRCRRCVQKAWKSALDVCPGKDNRNLIALQ